MKCLILGFALILLGCATEPPTIAKLNEHDWRISGKLDKPEYDEIIRIVKSHPHEPINFYVSSGGGTSADLLDAMDAVHEHGLTHWWILNQCDSACGIMALSTGHAHGGIRLHSFYKHYHHKILPAPEYNQTLLKKLDTYGYDSHYLNHMFHSVEELWDLRLEDGKIVE